MLVLTTLHTVMNIIMNMFLYFIVAFHLLWAGLNGATVVLLAMYGPWYVLPPILTYYAHIVFSPSYHCPLTSLENWVREKLNLPQIKDFLGHYTGLSLRLSKTDD